MKPTRAEILTGLLVLVTLTVGVVFLTMLGRGALFATGVDYYAYLDNSADLRPATPVHFEGQRVGSVQAVEWRDDRRAYRITLRVPQGIPVRVDSAVRMRSVKLLGAQFLEISAGTPTAAAAPPGSELAAEPFKAVTEGIDRLTQDFEPVLRELNGTLADLRRVFQPDGALGDLEGTMASLRRAADKLDAGATDLQRLLGDGEGGLRAASGKLNAWLDANTDRLTAAVTDTGDAAAALERVATGAEQPVQDVLAGARTVMAQLDRTVRDLQAALGRLEGSLTEVTDAATGTIGHAQRLLRDNEGDLRAAILAARAATENLQRAAAKVADRPSTLLFDTEDETSAAARERRDFERQLRDRGRADRYGKE